MSLYVLCVCLRVQMYVHELVRQLYHQPVHFLCSHDNENPREVRNWNQNCNKTNSSPRRTRLTSGTEQGDSKESEGPHPNLSSLLVALETDHAFYFVYPFLRFTLFDVLMHSPAMLEESVAKPLFVLHQLLCLLQFCHERGATLGLVGLRNVYMDARLWVQMRLPVESLALPNATPTGAKEREDVAAKSESHVGGGVTGGMADKISCEVELNRLGLDSAANNEDNFVLEADPIGNLSDNEFDSPVNTPRCSPHPSHGGSTHTLTGARDTPLPCRATPPLSNQYVPPYQYPPVKMRLCEATRKWRHGEISNFDYLLLLNYHAGRVPGDPNNHPIFPWVMAFTHRDGGYRDLSKSKYRLNKGDQQLDFTFISAQEELRYRGVGQDGLVPHHIGDISSDVTYYVYLARKTPREVLCEHVRPQWVPEEYPSSLEKMYTWSPDECIPEFFSDTSLFHSIHPDLPDLALPSWASCPKDVISTHLSVLEGDIVSSNLHCWIDIMFGYKLSGHDAVRAKNVYVSLVDHHKDPKNCGIVQLFKSSHPRRLQRSSAPLSVLEWSSYLNMTTLSNASLFNIQRGSDTSGGGVASSLSNVTANSRNGGTRDGSSSKKTSPEPGTQKTLEDIINQKNPPTLEETDLGQEEELTGSFEHVNMDDVRDKLTVHTSTPNVSGSSGTSNGGSGGGVSGGEAGMAINYMDVAGNTPFLEKGKGTPSSGKSARGESVVAVHPGGTGSRFKVPVVNMIFSRQRHKGHAPETEPVLDKGQGGVSLPREANFLQRLNRMEEMANFAFKSCRDDGTLYQTPWDSDNLPVFDVSVGWATFRMGRECVVSNSTAVCTLYLYCTSSLTKKVSLQERSSEKLQKVSM